MSLVLATLHVVGWLCALCVLAGVAYPLASRLFDDRLAATLALPLALVVVGLVTFWVGRITLALAPVAGVVVLAVLAGAAVVQHDDPWLPSRDIVVAPLVVFTVGFVTVLLLRLAEPGVVPAGGEKFLDYALLKALLRAPTLPAEDPWFAGEPIRYYYGGQLLVAALARVTATPARFAYPLGLATAYGLLLSAAYGVAGTLVGETHRPHRAHTGTGGADRRLAGVVGAFLVGLAGPLATPIRLALGALPDALALRYGRAAFVGIRAPLDIAYAEQAHLATYSPWDARYVVPDVLTAFPFWEFQNGDLHAHVVSTPLLVLVVGCALTYVRTPPAARRRRWTLLVVGAVVAGSLGVVNLWSAPTALGLLALAVVVAPAHPTTLVGDWRPARTGTALVGQLLVAAVVLSVLATVALAVGAPFYRFHTPLSRGVALSSQHSAFVPFLLAYGGLLLPVCGVLGTQLRRRVGWRPVAGVTLALVAVLGGLAVTSTVATPVFLAVLVALGLTVALTARVGTGGSIRRLALLVVAGAGILLVTELAYAVVWPFDPNAPRWNTVYKVSTQAWVLWGLAGGGAVARCWHARDGSVSVDTLRPRAVRLGLATLLVVSVTFGVVAVGGGVSDAVVDREVTDGESAFTVHDPQIALDATAYVAREHPDAARAIAWLDDRPGQPVVAAAPGDEMYQWSSAAASLTGLPTLAGWRHEAGYRGEAAYARRVAALETIYTGSWTNASAALARHDVRYVYVGADERDHYGTVSFDGLTGVRVAHRSGTVTIYAIDQSRLDVREGFRGRPRSGDGPRDEDGDAADRSDRLWD